MPSGGAGASAAGDGEFAAQFAAALQGLFGATTDSPGAPLVPGKGTWADGTTKEANASIPSGPAMPRKNAPANSASNAAVGGTPAAVAWLSTPQLMVPGPGVEAKASGSVSYPGFGTGESGSATAASRGESAWAVTPTSNAPAAERSLLPAVSTASTGGDTGASTPGATSGSSESRFADALSLAARQAIGATPQAFDEAGATSVKSLAPRDSAALTQTAGVIEGQEPAAGARTTRVNARTLAASEVPPGASATGGVPTVSPVGFSCESQVTDAQPASAAGPPEEAESSQASGSQETPEKKSSLMPFSPAGIGSLTAGGALPAEDAGTSAVQSAVSGGTAVAAAPAASTEVTALSAAAAVVAAAAGAQSAAPALAVPAAVAMRGAGAKVSSSGPPRVQSGPGTAVSSASPLTVMVNSSKSSPAGGQTPFAIFFPASAEAESAAAVFPKMLVPGTVNASPHNNVPTSAGVTNNTAPNSSANANTLPSGAPQTAKNPSSGNAEQNPTATSPAIHAANATAAAAATDSAQSSSGTAAPAGAQPGASGQVSAIVAAQAGNPPAAAEIAQKQGTLPGAPADAANTAPVPPASPQALPGPVQVAQMAMRAGQTEMRIGMNTSAFGSVEVRTVIHASDVGVVIGSEKGDLRGLLTNEMPAISTSLEQQNLRLSNVSFMQGFASGGNMGGGGNAQQQRPFSPAPSCASPNPEASSGSAHEPAELPPWQISSFGIGSLSVLA
jgi:hypothetical protein